MKSLIGHECRCVFNLPFNDWPFQGYPAWVVVVAVDMPMVCMSYRHGGKGVWVNAATIQTIESVKAPTPAPRFWSRRPKMIAKWGAM